MVQVHQFELIIHFGIPCNLRRPTYFGLDYIQLLTLVSHTLWDGTVYHLCSQLTPKPAVNLIYHVNEYIFIYIHIYTYIYTYVLYIYTPGVNDKTRRQTSYSTNANVNHLSPVWPKFCLYWRIPMGSKVAHLLSILIMKYPSDTIQIPLVHQPEQRDK